MYKYSPSTSRVIPQTFKEETFGVTRRVDYTDFELASARFLYISHIETGIAQFEESAEGCYAIKPGSEMLKNRMGTIQPFHGIGVSGEFQKTLLSRELKGLAFEPLLNSRTLWRLTSDITLPQFETELQDEKGDIVTPGDWPSQWSGKYINNHGNIPPELIYERIPYGFDVAKTYELTGTNRKRAFHWIVVSQKVRSLLESEQIPVRYTPIRVAFAEVT